MILTSQLTAYVRFFTYYFFIFGFRFTCNPIIILPGKVRMYNAHTTACLYGRVIVNHLSNKSPHYINNKQTKKTRQHINFSEFLCRPVTHRVMYDAYYSILRKYSPIYTRGVIPVEGVAVTFKHRPVNNYTA